MNFVEVIGDYDRAVNRRRRIIGMAIVIAIIALFFSLSSIGELFTNLSEQIYIEIDNPTPYQETSSSPVPTTVNVWGVSTHVPSPTSSNIQASPTVNDAASTVAPIPTNAVIEATSTLDAAEATRTWRSQAVQDAIRNRG